MSVYAVSDLHGRLDLWKQIKKFLKPEDKIYVLGDCGDKGPDGWELIKAVFTDSQAIYIKGNHEDLLAKAITEYVDNDGAYLHNQYLLFANGGNTTFEGWLMDNHWREWATALNELPRQAIYQNKNGTLIYMNHSGHHPLWNEHTGEYTIAERLAIWDRDHYLSDAYNVGDLPKGSVIIHGHTPIMSLCSDRGEYWPEDCRAYWYCNNQKVCIDTWTWATGQSVIINLDTFEEHVFIGPSVEW